MSPKIDGIWPVYLNRGQPVSDEIAIGQVRPLVGLLSSGGIANSVLNPPVSIKCVQSPDSLEFISPNISGFRKVFFTDFI